jgi:hypothetical protein
MKKQVLLTLLIIPAFLSAQDDSGYLAGAVPVENGMVVFSKEIAVSGLSQEGLYDKLLAWAEQRFQSENSQVVYTDKAKGYIVAVGEKMLIFTKTALSLDQSLMSYRMTFEFTGDRCTVKIRNIRYKYNVSYRREPELYPAGEMITDKTALTRKGKLNRLNGKFRTSTIDYVTELFGEIEKAATN